MKNFQDLHVWRKAHLLTLEIYKVTAVFPKQENLWNHEPDEKVCSFDWRANIAEGCGKRSNAEFQHFLGIAAGSASELEYHILVAHDLRYIDRATYEALNRNVIEVKRMLASLILKVESERLAG